MIEFKEVVRFGIAFIVIGFINAILLWLSKLCNPKDEQYKINNKFVVIYGGLIPISIYILLNFGSFCAKVLDDFSRDYKVQNIMFERALIGLALLIFYLIKLICKSNQNNKEIKYCRPYIQKEKEGQFFYYIDAKYKQIGKELQKISIVLAVMFSLGEGIFVYNNYRYTSLRPMFWNFVGNYGYIICIALIYLVVYEIGVALDGEIEPKEYQDVKELHIEDKFNEMLKEYKSRFKENILLTLDKNEKLKDDNELSKDDYVYSEIFSPIVEGKNIIIETENMYVLNNILPPLINLILATNRNILFITENDEETLRTQQWLRDCKVITGNLYKVVKVFTEDNKAENYQADTNVDICIGCIEQLLEHKDITKQADTIFSINIDNIIVNSPIDLSILTRVLASEQSKRVQYVLFANIIEWKFLTTLWRTT